MADSLTTLIAHAGALSLRELVLRAGKDSASRIADLVKDGVLQVTSGTSGFAAHELTTPELASRLEAAATSPEAEEIEITPTKRGWRTSVSAS